MSRPIPSAVPRCALVVLLALATALVACGRKGSPVPPEGEESRYAYPSFYPSGGSGIPIFGRDPLAADEPVELADPIEPAPGRTVESEAEESPRSTFGEGPAITPANRDYTEPGPYGTSSQ